MFFWLPLPSSSQTQRPHVGPHFFDIGQAFRLEADFATSFQPSAFSNLATVSIRLCRPPIPSTLASLPVFIEFFPPNSLNVEQMSDLTAFERTISSSQSGRQPFSGRTGMASR